MTIVARGVLLILGDKRSGFSQLFKTLGYQNVAVICHSNCNLLRSPLTKVDNRITIMSISVKEITFNADKYAFPIEGPLVATPDGATL